MKIQTLSLSAIAALALVTAPAAIAQDAPALKKAGPVLLKSQLTAGKTYKYRTEMEMTMDSPLGGDEKTSTKMSMDMGMTVGKAGADGNKTVTTKFDRVKMAMSMAGQEMVYDSADKTKQNALLKTAFAGIADKEFKATYDKNDKFQKMEGDAPAAGLGGMGINKDQVEQILQQLTDYGFPETPVKPGEKWEHTQKTNMGQMGNMEVAMQFTYKGQTELEGVEVAEIDFTGSVAGKGDAALVTFKDSKMYGKMHFDTKLGAIRRSTVDMDMTMAVGGAQGAEMETSTKSTQKLLSVE